MNNTTTGVNETSKFLLKKEINETDLNEYPAVGNYCFGPWAKALLGLVCTHGHMPIGACNVYQC